MTTLILLIVLFNYLRKILQTKNTMPRWNTLFFAGILLAAILLGLGSAFPEIKPFIVWTAHASLFFMIYLLLTKIEFQPAKLFVYAIMPMAVMKLFEDAAKIISPSFYDKWETYFNVADIFTVIWLITMMIVNKRQRKALLKEREKTAAREREAKIAEQMKAVLEVQVAERTAELLGQKQELEKTLDELKAAQLQLVQSEKMASLGELTAGIAHEIQNPLNFVNNFSEVNKELLAELKDEIEKGNINEVIVLANDVIDNEEKIIFHGKRADAIVKGMLLLECCSIPFTMASALLP